MCGCLVVLLGAFMPRVALALIWIFSNLVTRAFDTFVLPLLGIVLLPYTTLIYVLVYQPVTGVSGFGWLLVILGFILDIASYTGGAYGNRDRLQREAA